jgi:NADH pyrophosphatase NudC (nudix superfamily)
VKEETGLSIIVDKPVYVFEYIVEKPNEIRDVTQINFLARLANPNQEIRINKKEHEEARWFTKEEILSLKEISKEVRNCAIMALETLS